MTTLWLQVAGLAPNLPPPLWALGLQEAGAAEESLALRLFCLSLTFLLDAL